MSTPGQQLLLLVARPTPAGVDERSLTALADAVAARTPHPVRVAHLDQAEPSIHDALDDAVAAGTTDVLVVPLAVPDDRYLTAWLGRAVANWRETRGVDLDVSVAGSLAWRADVAELIAGLVDEPAVPVFASAAAFRSPAWSELPRVDRHLLVCRGPRCTAYGAGAVHRALEAAVRYEPGTLVNPIGCLGPCNVGPTVVEHPPGTWHTGLDAASAAALADATQRGRCP